MVAQLDFISAAGLVEGKQQGVFTFIEADAAMLLHVLVAIGAQGALSAIFFTRGEEEIRWQLARHHDSCACCVEPPLKGILPYHYSIIAIIIIPIKTIVLMEI